MTILSNPSLALEIHLVEGKIPRWQIVLVGQMAMMVPPARIVGECHLQTKPRALGTSIDGGKKSHL